MYAVTTPTILFYYKTVDLIDRLKMYSGMPMRSMVDNEKNPVKIESLFITDDDTTFIYAECNRAIAKIFQGAHRIAHSLIDSLLQNESIVINTVSTNVYGFYILNKAAYNPNLVPMVDTAIEDLLVSMVLSEWFTITRQYDFLKIEQEKQPGLQIAYNNLLTEFYKPKVESLDVLPVFTNETITVDPETGNTTEIIVVVPDEQVAFIDDIPFIFADIDTDPGQIYPIDLKAAWAYKLLYLTLETDTGTIIVNLAINNVQVEGMVEIDATTTKTTFVAQYNNDVPVNGDVILEIINLIDSPTRLVGKLVIERT